MKNRYYVKPGMKVCLKEWDPEDLDDYEGKKEEVKKEIDALNARIETMQEMLYAENKHKMLIVLQGMDASGKDGTIRNVFDGVNPQGVRVASFKVPSAEELSHDYLWRVHKQVPGKGEIVIFNRSHYEDVLVVRVHELVPKSVWQKRYRQICEFEKMLAEEGTVILKFFLHIDRDEQKKRLQARLNDPEKQWKFNIKDLDERKRWDEYINAYEDVLSRTSAEWAPWYIIPANHKWYRNLVISSIMVKALEDLKMKYPQPEVNLEGVIIE